MDKGIPKQRRTSFGRRRIAPRVSIIDSKSYIRTFLSETFEELGFIAEGQVNAAELTASLDAIPPDLILIVVSRDPDGAEDVLDTLASAAFHGKVLLLGAPSLPALAHLQQRGGELGLAMLPVLSAPFRTRDLRCRLSGLLPAGTRPSLPVDVVEALGNDWLELWYQPKVDPRSLQPCGVEALIRLRHPTWGVVPPACFLPREDDPHFVALSDLVVTKAMADWMRFAIDYLPIEISIHLPAAVLEDADLVGRLGRQLPDHPAFSRLIVEVSGAELAGDLTRMCETAQRLSRSGVGISIDNVGVECRSLADLDNFPVAEIKVARAFVGGCAQDRLKRGACGTILDIAQRLGARTVAAGVETRADLFAVREMGFDLAQGLLFGKPMEAHKFARTLWREVTVSN